MLYFVTGASGSGKTTCIEALRTLLPNAVVHDFDDIGVPENPDKIWRQESTERWLKRYLDEGTASEIYCICGQVVLGEILACSSAEKVGKIKVCLLDVSDIERIRRLSQRNTYGADQNMLNWAAWLRMHHHDPGWEQHVITQDCWSGLDCSRWLNQDNWNTLADVSIIDTTTYSIEEVAAEIKKDILKMHSNH